MRIRLENEEIAQAVVNYAIYKGIIHEDAKCDVGFETILSEKKLIANIDTEIDTTAEEKRRKAISENPILPQTR